MVLPYKLENKNTLQNERILVVPSKQQADPLIWERLREELRCSQGAVRKAQGEERILDAVCYHPASVASTAKPGQLFDKAAVSVPVNYTAGAPKCSVRQLPRISNGYWVERANYRGSLQRSPCSSWLLRYFQHTVQIHNVVYTADMSEWDGYERSYISVYQNSNVSLKTHIFFDLIYLAHLIRDSGNY